MAFDKTRFGCHYLPSTPGGTILLQRNKLRAPTDSPLLVSGIFMQFVFVIMPKRLRNAGLHAVKYNQSFTIIWPFLCYIIFFGWAVPSEKYPLLWQFRGHWQLSPEILRDHVCGTSLWQVYHRLCAHRVMQDSIGSGHFIWHIAAVTCSSSAVGHFHSNITEYKQVVIGCCRSCRITYED